MNGLELARLKNAYEGGPSPDSSAIRLPLTDEITQTLLINYEVTPDRCHTTPEGCRGVWVCVGWGCGPGREKSAVRPTGAQALPKGVLLLRIIAHRHHQSSKCSFSCRWSVTRLGVTPSLIPVAPFSRRFRRAGLRVR